MFLTYLTFCLRIPQKNKSRGTSINSGDFGAHLSRESFRQILCYELFVLFHLLDTLSEEIHKNQYLYSFFITLIFNIYFFKIWYTLI